MPALPTFPADNQFESATDALLRYIYDALTGGIGGGGGVGFYNTPVIKQVAATTTHSILADTCHSITVRAIGGDATVDIGGSDVITIPAGQTQTFQATTLFNTRINVNALAGCTAHVWKMIP